MRRLIWMLFLLGGYLWVVTSGKEQMLIQRGKAVYNMIVEWLDGADTDFQFKDKTPKRKSRKF